MLVAHEDRAELEPALQARYSGPDRVDIAIRHEQIVAARVGGHHNGPGGKQFGHRIAR